MSHYTVCQDTTLVTQNVMSTSHPYLYEIVDNSQRDTHDDEDGAGVEDGHQGG